MNKSYKVVGWILIFIGIFWVLLSFFPIGLFPSSDLVSIFKCKTCDMTDYFYEFGIYLFSIILIFLFSYFPARAYIRVERDNRLLKTSLIFTIIALVIALFSSFYALFYPYHPSDAGYEHLIVFAIGWVISAFPYGIAVLLLIINWFRNKT